jgi:formate/nitrite transporter
MRNSHELITLVNSIGEKKAKEKSSKLFILGILAGFYISFGAIFFTTVVSYGGHPAAIKLLGGIAFSLGLVLVVLAGAELFTGNNLMVFSYLNKKILLKNLIKNWVIVYFGNLVGSLVIVLLMFLSKQYLQDESIIGAKALNIANAKVNLGFSTALVRAILCNILVCLAIWLTMVSKSIPGKIIGIIFPISAFVTIGYEHSVANMYFIPMGMVIKNFAPTGFWMETGLNFNSFQELGLSNFLINNLLPVTLGNIIGGVCFVDAFYWFIYKEESK